MTNYRNLVKNSLYATLIAATLSSPMLPDLSYAAQRRPIKQSQSEDRPYTIVHINDHWILGGLFGNKDYEVQPSGSDTVIVQRNDHYSWGGLAGNKDSEVRVYQKSHKSPRGLEQRITEINRFSQQNNLDSLGVERIARRIFEEYQLQHKTGARHTNQSRVTPSVEHTTRSQYAPPQQHENITIVPEHKVITQTIVPNYDKRDTRGRSDHSILIRESRLDLMKREQAIADSIHAQAYADSLAIEQARSDSLDRVNQRLDADFNEHCHEKHGHGALYTTLALAVGIGTGVLIYNNNHGNKHPTNPGLEGTQTGGDGYH